MRKGQSHSEESKRKIAEKLRGTRVQPDSLNRRSSTNHAKQDFLRLRSLNSLEFVLASSQGREPEYVSLPEVPTEAIVEPSKRVAAPSQTKKQDREAARQRRLENHLSKISSLFPE